MHLKINYSYLLFLFHRLKQKSKREFMENNYLSNKPLSILKASLPFLPPNFQKAVSYYVKAEEFNLMCNSLDETVNSPMRACDTTDGGFSKKELIDAVSAYLNDGERELINMFYNLTTALNMYSEFKSFSNFENGDLLPVTISNTTANENVNQNFTSDNNEINANNNPGFNIEMLKNMLSPSQKLMFDKCSSLLNSEGGLHV